MRLESFRKWSRETRIAASALAVGTKAGEWKEKKVVMLEYQAV
jgi:hypothetical protein